MNLLARNCSCHSSLTQSTTITVTLFFSSWQESIFCVFGSNHGAVLSKFEVI